MLTLVILTLQPLTSGKSQPQLEDMHRSLSARAVRIDGSIRVDGNLDEPEWQLAEPATNFIQRLPTYGLPATERTEVRILYDDVNIYVGVYCFDSAGREGIVVNDITKDFFTLDSDGFQVIFDTFNDDRNAFLFGTNPAAGKFDMQIREDGNAGNSSWDGIWFVEAQITDQGWQVEIEIPFKTLRFSAEEIQVWGVNFERRVRRKFEDSYWAPLEPQYRLGRISRGGALEGIQDITQGRNLWIKPFLSAPITRREDDDVDFQPDIGVDVKYGVTSELTLDLTANTDFSQVEADEQQVNLTRFSLFFPEKRDFFLENAGIFEFGKRRRGHREVPDIIPFFSRRIGLTEEGEIVPIIGGARLTGNAAGLTLGMLTMSQTEFDTVDDDEQPLHLPTTNYSVIRVRRDILRKSDIGGLFINKAAGENGFNRTYGADGNFTFFNYLDLSGYLLKTESPDLKGEDLAGNVAGSWEDDFYQVRAGHLRIGENFNPEVGFAPRTGIHKSSAEFGITPRPEETIPWIREINPDLEFDYVTNTENVLETRRLEGAFRVTFSDSSSIRISRESWFERLFEDFEIRDGVTIPVGDYNFADNSLSYQSDRSRFLSLEGRYGWGSFFGGERENLGAQVILTPSYKLQGSVQWSHNNLDLPGGAFTTDLISTKIDYSFSTRMFLNALIQYNSDDREISSNIRFDFVHRPLSDLYVVYNERRTTSGEVLDRAVIVKLTYLFAF